MDLLTTAEAAEFMRVPIATLRFWVREGTAPPSARIGKRRVWRRADCEAWINAKFEAQDVRASLDEPAE